MVPRELKALEGCRKQLPPGSVMGPEDCPVERDALAAAFYGRGRDLLLALGFTESEAQGSRGQNNQK